MQTSLPKNDVVLLGIGHTNAHVLRMWKMKPIADARLTCVSNFAVSTYSGMLPGVLAGQYPNERMQIDLVRLCAAAGARLIQGEVTGLDRAGRRLLLDGRPPIPFDVLSIGIGSIPKQPDVQIESAAVLPIKPMQTFLARLEERLRSILASGRLRLSEDDGAMRCQEAGVGGEQASVTFNVQPSTFNALSTLNSQPSTPPLRAAIVGGGAGGVEIAFCLPGRVRAVLGDVPLEITLIDAHDQLAAGVQRRTAERVRQNLEARGVRLMLGRRVKGVVQGEILLENDEPVEVDLVLWATSATAPPLLRSFGLPTDDEGFLLTRATLQTTAGDPIFAVGDTGTIEGDRTPKAGVYAVRQGPVLWENLARLLDGRPLKEYVPQKGFLKLLNRGDGRAIGEYKGVAFEGRWAWKLKDFIDGRFMDKYQDYRPMEMDDAVPAGRTEPMRCAGCGGKVGGSILSRVLARLEVPDSEHVLVGLSAPDDAAVVRTSGGTPMTVTTDFFAAPLDDPYFVGRIAALNALSDAWAMGARPLAALALVTLPVGAARGQEQLLFDLLTGSLEEFRRIDTALVGGHTIEGPRLTIGFTVLADQGDAPPHTKGGLRVGDQLILTKPLGTGVLLAAHMQARCRAEWMQPLLRSLLLSNQPAASLVEEYHIAGLTDVTGFGLAGHLLEMLRAGRLDAELRLDAIPLLPGAAELFSEGVESTLAPANRLAAAELEGAATRRGGSPRYKALFDPQTNGGLLLGVAEEHVDAVLGRLAQQSDLPAAVVGRVLATASQRGARLIAR